MDKVCVLMTCYNPKSYLVEQVDSILNQQGVEVELIIRDDASSDKTWIRKVKKDSRVTVLEADENIGVAHNILELFRYACTFKKNYKYFAYSDQDDYWKEEKLKRGVAAIKKLDPSRPGLYYSNLLVVDEQLKNPHLLFKENIVKNTIYQSLAQIFTFACTTMFNMEMMQEILENSIEYMGIDHLLYYLAIINRNVIYDENSYILYRQHGDNVSGDKTRGFKCFIERVKRVLSKEQSQDLARAGGGSFKMMAQYIEKYYMDKLSEEEQQAVKMVAHYETFGDRVKIMRDKRIRAGYQPKDFYRNIRLLRGNY